MRKWYRAMVVFLTVSAVFCISSVAYVGFQLWYWGENQRTFADGDRIEWNNGLYEGTGILSDGVIAEMTIRRVRPTP